MKAAFLNMVARFLARPAVTDWLIRRAKRTPYRHIIGPDGSVYMKRYWLFNPYEAESDGARPWWHFPIGIRLHHIWREDDDRGALHDHPWNARTFVLRGWYKEVRMLCMHDDGTQTDAYIKRRAGATASLEYGEYHRITKVSPGGVWTLFITGRKRGTWGFLVNGKKVQWRKFLGIPEAP